MIKIISICLLLSSCTLMIGNDNKQDQNVESQRELDVE